MLTFIKDHLWVLIVCIIAGILFAIVPLSGHNFFVIGLLTSACLYVVYVVSWDLLEGYTGMLNFGQLIFAGVAGYTVALLELNSGIGHTGAIIVGVLVGTFSSLLLSIPSLRVRSTYFAIVSFSVLLVCYKVTMTFIKVFGGDYGLAIHRVFSREALFYASIVIMAFAVIASRVLVKSRFGMALQAIREDEETARAVGINIRFYKLLICLVSAFFTSLAGICFFYTMGHVGPEIFSMMGSTDVLIMGVVGGQGSVFGAAIGGALLALLLEVMRPVAEYRNLLYAFLLVLVVMFAPKGIWGGMTSLIRKWNQRK